jgi:hypothetical protein
LLEGEVFSLRDACLRRRQIAAVAVGADMVAEGRMRGETTAPEEAFNGICGYVWYMHATDAHPPVVVDNGVWEDDIIAAALQRAPDDDGWGAFPDPVPSLVAEVCRLLALVAELRAPSG